MGCHYGNSVPSSRPSPEIRASPAPSPSSPEPRKSNSPRASSESSSSSSSSGSRSVVMGSEAICTTKAKHTHARQLDRPRGGACVCQLEFLPSPLRETSCFSADRRCSLWPYPGSRPPHRCRLRRRPRSRAGTGSCPARSRPGALWSSLFPRSYERNTILDDWKREQAAFKTRPPKPEERVYVGKPPLSSSSR